MKDISQVAVSIFWPNMQYTLAPDTISRVDIERR